MATTQCTVLHCNKTTFHFLDFDPVVKVDNNGQILAIMCLQYKRMHGHSLIVNLPSDTAGDRVERRCFMNGYGRYSRIATFCS